MVVFTWVIKLDSKNRIVLPLEARRSLGVADSIVLKKEKDKIILTNYKDLKREELKRVSKNHYEWPQ